MFRDNIGKATSGRRNNLKEKAFGLEMNVFE